MSVTNGRVTRSKRLIDVTNRFPRPSSRSPQRTDFIVSTTVMKRPKATEIPEKRIKRNGTAIEPTASMSQEPEETTPANRYELSLKTVLTEAYCDIPARLKIPTPPKCIFNLEKCYKNHFQNGYINCVENGPDLKNFLKNENPMLFLHLVNMMTAQNKFLDGDTLQLLLELILSINENCDANGNYSADGVIDGATIAFLNTLNAFPPCWSGSKKTYRQLLLGPIFRRGFLVDDGFDTKQSLLMNIIGCMEQLLLLESADPAHSSLLHDSEDLLDYHVWEAKTTQKYKFQRLKRNQKIDRLFLVLALLVQTMEYDLVNWMMIHARCPNGSMARTSKTPLIGSVLWSDGQHRQINFVIKRIIRLFIDYVSIDFPKEKISILSRLINLMYTTLDLCDNKMTDGVIVYPNVVGNTHNHGDYFCSTVYTQLRENRAYDTKLCTKLIDSIQMPSLKLYLITKFVGDLNQHEIALNPKSIRKALVNLTRTCNHDINDNDIDQNENRAHSMRDDDAADDAADDYPFMEIVRKKSSSTISAREYAKLLIVALDAYANIHHIDEFERLNSRAQQFYTDSENYRSELTQLKKKKLRVFNKQNMRKRGPALIAKQLETAKYERTYEYNVTSPNISLRSAVEIFVDLEMQIRFREDVKFYDLIKLDEHDVLKRLLRR